MSLNRTTRQVALDRWSELKNELDQLRPMWRDINELIDPMRGRFLADERKVQGHKRHDQRFNRQLSSAASFAKRTLESGMMAGITSPARPWFKLSSGDADLDEVPEVAEWLHAVRQLLLDICAESNFYRCIRPIYGTLGAYGTAVLYIMPNFDNVIHCYAAEAGECAVDIDSLMAVNTVYRRDNMKVHQLVDRFGIEPMSNEIKDHWRNKRLNPRYDVLHLVEPRDHQLRMGPPSQRMPWRNAYMLLDTKSDNIEMLREDGFQEKPFMAPRWEPTNEPYSPSPGMLALGDVRELQTKVRRKAQGIDKMVNPPMTGPSSLKNQQKSTVPGGITYVEGGGAGQRFEPAYTVNLGLRELREDIEETKAAIREAFFADLFMMLSLSDRREITATEVAERHEEKLLMLGPVMESVQTELLDPAIDRIFGIAMRAGIVPEIPQELEGREISVTYTSLLSQAQQIVGIGPIERLLGTATALAATDPEVMDKIDSDQVIDEMSRMLGTPPELIRDDEQVEDIRTGRAQQLQQQQAMEAAPQAAQAAKVLSDAKVPSDENLLGRLTGF